LADGVTVAAISDETGDERVQVWKDGATRTLPWDIGRVVSMRAAPRGARLAIANHRNEVLCGDLDTGTLTVVDRSEDGRTEEVAWSPEGAWIAYSFWTDPRHTAIKLYDVANNTSTLVTQPEFNDYAPAFDPLGKYLYFLSIRTFDPVYDAVQFELSFPRAARPYLIALQSDVPPPFEPAPKGLKPGDPAKVAQRESPPATIRVDLPGIARRVSPFPVPEGRYGQIAGVAGDKVIWTLLPIVGAHGRGGHKEAPGRLELFDFDTLRTETLLDKVD